MEQSVYQQLRQLEFSLGRIWNSTDAARLETAARKSLETVKRHMRSAKTAARDYELSQFEEDLKAQVRFLPKVVKALEQLRASLLKASEYDIIGAVDVAHTSAQLDELIDRLK